MVRLQEQLKDEINLEIQPLPYLLYPHIPLGGLPKSHFAKKTKTGMGKALKHEAHQENISINYKLIDTIPNSLEAHRLIQLIPNNEQKYALTKAIFYTYFEKGKNIEDHDVLIDLAKSIGVDKEIIGQFFGTSMGKEAVQIAINKSKEDFISIVPSLRLDHQFMIPGLQSIEVWENYIRRAATIQKQKKENID